MSLRLTDGMEERLDACAAAVKLSKNALAQAAIEAAVEAIEKNGGKLVLPLEFDVTHEAVAKSLAPTVKTGPKNANIVHLPKPSDASPISKVAEDPTPYDSKTGTNQ